MSFVSLTAVLILFSVAGFLTGFFTVNFNHLLVIFFGRLWLSGYARKRYGLVGVIAAALNFVIFSLSGFETIQSILFSLFFLALFAVGVKSSERRFRESGKILEEIVNAVFPPGGPIALSASDVKAGEAVKRFLSAMPASYREALKTLAVAFDSMFFVFVISLLEGKLRLRRFIRLTRADREEYIRAWERRPGLTYAIQVFKILSSFGYYSKEPVWRQVGYDGELLRRSYLR